MMVVMGEVGEDEFEADFDDDEGDDEADIGFDIDSENEVDKSGGEDGDGNPSVVHSLSAGGDEDLGIEAATGAFKINGEEIFSREARDKDDKSGDGVVGSFVWVNELFDGFDDDFDTGGNNDKGDNNSSDAFDFRAVAGEPLVVC